MFMDCITIIHISFVLVTTYILSLKNKSHKHRKKKLNKGSISTKKIKERS
ncbi:hypothetical protein XBJ1_2361 [Xenorhabdus bovienii SS-2004]|uniref:Uncharacterized protein n=1 Tax=Xenorhabdus bovienii (strain SS-2004) TaxID=406818 RepID=D3V1E3_XENBS|nr:hypothetical protein XBJ1_2361 [Xenorhabdus bovienii SS-2004]